MCPLCVCVRPLERRRLASVLSSVLCPVVSVGTLASHPLLPARRNTTFPVDPNDNRRIDCLVTGTGLHQGRPLFCDATVRSPLKGTGEPHPRAANTDGAVLRKARKDKERKYGDLAASPLAELVVLACEVGGRWSDETGELVRLLAKGKVKNEHPLLRRSAELAWHDRW